MNVVVEHQRKAEKPQTRTSHKIPFVGHLILILVKTSPIIRLRTATLGPVTDSPQEHSIQKFRRARVAYRTGSACGLALPALGIL